MLLLVGIAVITVGIFGVIVATNIQFWQQALTFVAALIVVSVLFFFGKRWLDGRS